tara:strand:+ start:14580 stop:14849 length:270 start_codon:yes stop_codon:yes gene_type:complete
MEKKQFIELLEKNAIFQFELLCENIVSYETVIPKFDGSWYVNYRIELFYNQDVIGLHRYSTLNLLLDEMEIHSIIEIKENKNEVTIYKK